MYDICRLCNFFADGGTFFALKESQCCRRYECGKGVHTAGLYRTADGGCADGCSFAFLARDHSAFDVGKREIVEHNFIVEACDTARLFFTNIAASDGERLCDTRINGDIELCMAAHPFENSWGRSPG